MFKRRARIPRDPTHPVGGRGPSSYQILVGATARRPAGGNRHCGRPPTDNWSHCMARVSGVDIPRDKRVEVALTYVFGIGRTLSQQTLAVTGVHPDTRVRDLSEDDL